LKPYLISDVSALIVDYLEPRTAVDAVVDTLVRYGAWDVSDAQKTEEVYSALTLGFQRRKAVEKILADPRINVKDRSIICSFHLCVCVFRFLTPSSVPWL
jgi:hypothetical protein